METASNFAPSISEFTNETQMLHNPVFKYSNEVSCDPPMTLMESNTRQETNASVLNTDLIENEALSKSSHDVLAHDPDYTIYLENFFKLFKDILTKLVAVNLQHVKYLIGLCSSDQNIMHYVQTLKVLKKTFEDQNNSIDKTLSTFITRSYNTLNQKIVKYDTFMVISKIIQNSFEKTNLTKFGAGHFKIESEYFYSDFVDFKLLMFDLVDELFPLEYIEKISHSGDKNLLGESDLRYLKLVLKPIETIIQPIQKKTVVDPRRKNKSSAIQINVSLNRIKFTNKTGKKETPAYNPFEYKKAKYTKYLVEKESEKFSANTDIFMHETHSSLDKVSEQIDEDRLAVESSSKCMQPADSEVTSEMPKIFENESSSEEADSKSEIE